MRLLDYSYLGLLYQLHLLFVLSLYPLNVKLYVLARNTVKSTSELLLEVLERLKLLFPFRLFVLLHSAATSASLYHRSELFVLSQYLLMMLLPFLGFLSYLAQLLL